MSNKRKIAVKIFGIALALFIVQVNAFAGGPKVIEKSRKAVENAAPHDWHTFASAASMCIEKSVNWEEALSWVQKSIKIKETSYNLEVLGDYYFKNSMYEEAIEQYVKSMDKAKEKNVKAQVGDLQAKIAKAHKLRFKS